LSAQIKIFVALHKVPYFCYFLVPRFAAELFAFQRPLRDALHHVD
jgi:hypothetical protein